MMEERTVKVKFVDFWSDEIKNMTMPLLRRHFANVVESEEPDFLFYSLFGYEHLKYDCVRIELLGENFCPDFNICDYAVGFHHLQFQDRYRRIPLYYFYLEDYEKARKKHLQEIGNPSEKKFCNFVYSNSDASPERDAFFNLLSNYKNVDSGGRHLNNIGGPVENKWEFQRQYKFSIAFENTSNEGYSTEKILQAFAAGTIPIYWGDPLIGESFNEKAFLNCHAYGSFEEVVKKVMEIDQNDDLYRQYLREPMGTAETFPENPLKKWEEFIVSICSQDPQKAMRRNNRMVGERYQADLKRFRLGEVQAPVERRSFFTRVAGRLRRMRGRIG